MSRCLTYRGPRQNPGRVERRQRGIRSADEERDLRAAEHHRIGALLSAFIHDSGEHRLRRFPEHATDQFVEDERVDLRPPVGRRNLGLDAPRLQLSRIHRAFHQRPCSENQQAAKAGLRGNVADLLGDVKPGEPGDVTNQVQTLMNRVVRADEQLGAELLKLRRRRQQHRTDLLPSVRFDVSQRNPRADTCASKPPGAHACRAARPLPRKSSDNRAPRLRR